MRMTFDYPQQIFTEMCTLFKSIDEEQKKVFTSSDALYSSENIGEEQKEKVLTSSDALYSGLGNSDILYFLFIECIGAFTFLNEYRIWPCLYYFSALFDIPYSILFVQVTSSHFSKFKIIVGMSLPCFS